MRGGPMEHFTTLEIFPDGSRALAFNVLGGGFVLAEKREGEPRSVRLTTGAASAYAWRAMNPPARRRWWHV
jgi:hypothetical protein